MRRPPVYQTSSFRAYKPPKKPVWKGSTPGAGTAKFGDFGSPAGPTTAQAPGVFVGQKGVVGSKPLAINTGPDYGSLIGGDWEVQDAEAAMASGMARARGDFMAQLRAGLIDYGLSDTSKLGSLGQYIDADTIKAAVENKYSATAVAKQQAIRSRAANNASLAARGILSSGQTTKSQEDVTAAQEAQGYQALRDFLAGGQQGLTGLADREESYARGIAQARAAAAARAAEIAALQGQGGGGEEGVYHPVDWRGALGLGRQGTGVASYGRPTNAPTRAPLKAGYVRSPTGGQYMRQSTFNKLRPQGDYFKYLDYIKRHGR